ncbi:hypothetical protein OG413_39430 [Streptomyces sp. NBC_01433]|uniref:hypothetical protein n=1 Tax=Streptomyces sp. NBC_01433 TaxID=2903864 RepID=UPI00224C8BAB|nr:hypothetical protein [Streptomyces sp. NBC_01433]MCX4681271.1 hypothetical protein [Streptomyces sp. NBC_01433]
MARHDSEVYPGTYVTCVFNPDKALCRPRPARGGRTVPVPHDCQPLECRNVALTAANTTALAAEADRLDLLLRARPPSRPFRRPTWSGDATRSTRPPTANGTAHRRPMPSRTDVLAAIDILTAETGRRPSVPALAARPDLANTTFRRNYPGICAELSAIPRAPGDMTAADAHAKVKTDNAQLRRDNRDLAHQLDLAVAAIQRLSIDNDLLQAALHDARAVTALPRHR